MASKSLSIVVCSYDRYADLEQCAFCVDASASFDRDRHELIVVDNTPPERRRKPDLPESARLFVSEPPGVSRARNTAVRVAEAPLIAFIDDDVRVTSGWCAALEEFFDAHPDALGCGGRTDLVFESNELPPWLDTRLEAYLSGLDLGGEARPIARDEWIVGGNMAFRREVFEHVGRFATDLGRTGKSGLLGNEEMDLVDRIGRSRVFYVPMAIADHRVAAERLTPEWFRRRVAGQARSDLISGATPAKVKNARKKLERLPIAWDVLLTMEPRDPRTFQMQLEVVYFLTLLMDQGQVPPPTGRLRQWRRWLPGGRPPRRSTSLGAAAARRQT